MKKLFGIFLLFATILCFALLSTDASAADSISGTCGDNLTWSLDDQGTMRIYGTGAMDDYSYVKAPWYSSRELIKSIIIGDGVTYIGKHAFATCTNLSDVTLPKTLEKIAGDAFLFSYNIENVHISDLKAWFNISFEIFYIDNSFAQSIEGYGNPLYYAENLYLNGKLVTDLVIPEGVTQIQDYAFVGCDCLTSVTIPEGVTKIGFEAFFRCTDLTKVSIPSSVTEISDGAFSDCTNLSDVYITDIAAWCAINGNYLVVDSPVKPPPDFEFNSIPSWNPLHYGAKLYLNQEPVTDLVIPDGVEAISQYAFDGFVHLTRITLPESIEKIGMNAFLGCENFKTVIYHGSDEQWNAIKIGRYNDTLKQAELIHHVAESSTVKSPTCTDVGYTIYKCAICGESYIGDKTPPTGHTYQAVVTEPTCSKIGYTTYTCTCGDTYQANEVPMTAHHYDNGVMTKNPTYEEEGVCTYTCIFCGHTKSGNVPRLEASDDIPDNNPDITPTEPVNPENQVPSTGSSANMPIPTCQECANEAKLITGWAWFIAMSGVTCLLIALLILLHVNKKNSKE